VEGETGYFSETCETDDDDDDGTEEISVKAENAVDIKEEVSIKFEAVYIKDEIPETATYPPIVTEHEVSLLCFWSVYCSKKESLKLHLTTSCFVLYCACRIAFEIWIEVLKRRDFL
jgi:hypothetical protein